MVELKDIPEDQICTQIKNLILAGWKKICLVKQSDGNWTITASD